MVCAFFYPPHFLSKTTSNVKVHSPSANLFTNKHYCNENKNPGQSTIFSLLDNSISLNTSILAHNRLGHPATTVVKTILSLVMFHVAIKLILISVQLFALVRFNFSFSSSQNESSSPLHLFM